MAKAKHTTEPTSAEPSFATLAAAVSPQWGETILRLTKATDRLSNQLDRFVGTEKKADTVTACRELAQELINFLDELDDTENHMELEPEDEADDSELEPSLGSFDRVVDQSKAWQQRGEFCSGNDAEQDEADDEPSLGSVGDMHFNQENWAAGKPNDRELDGAESGIGDQDGLDEQVPFRDWQNVGMV